MQNEIVLKSTSFWQNRSALFKEENLKDQNKCLENKSCHSFFIFIEEQKLGKKDE